MSLHSAASITQACLQQTPKARIIVDQTRRKGSNSERPVTQTSLGPLHGTCEHLNIVYHVACYSWIMLMKLQLQSASFNACFL